MCGRYFSGDIEGKFWFAVQASDDASFFGGNASEPNYIDYYFEKGDLPDIQNGIEECKKELGDYKAKLDKFFERDGGYNDEMIVKEFEITKEKVETLLEWYARLELGEKILKCVEENGECSFEAEL